MKKIPNLLKMFRVCNIETIASDTVADTVIQGELNGYIIQVKCSADGMYTFTCLVTADGNLMLFCTTSDFSPSFGMIFVYDAIVSFENTHTTNIQLVSMLDTFIGNQRNFVGAYGPGLRMRALEFDFICYIKTSVQFDKITWPDEGLEICLWCLNKYGDIVPFPDGEIWKVSALNSKLKIADPEVRALMDS